MALERYRDLYLVHNRRNLTNITEIVQKSEKFE